MSLESPSEHIRHIRRDKFGWADDGTKQSNPLELDLRQALKHLAEELYSKRHHFILELVQNAEDNAYREGDSPALTFRLLEEDPTHTPGAEGCLLLLNNELGFQPAQVESLCAVGQTTKTKREGYIGEKGIGFKSVFQVSERPHVFSSGYRFHFRLPELDVARGDTLGYIVPHWVECGLAAEPTAGTAILLPLKPGQRDTIAAQLRAIAAETILFLTKLAALHIETGPRRQTVARDATDGFVTLTCADSVARYFVCRKTWCRPPDLHEEKRTGVEQREVTVALPMDGAVGSPGRLFAFLPTECDSGLPFLVNADFLLTANRETLLDERPWNQWLRDCIASVFTAAFEPLLHLERHRCDVYRFIPLRKDLRQMSEFFRPVVDVIQRELSTQSCVLTQTGELVRPSNAWFAGKTERSLLFSGSPPPGLTAIAFVAPELERWRERLRAIGVRDFEISSFLRVINDLTWLQQREDDWWAAALEFLAERKVQAAAVAKIPLLRCADGVCRAPDAGNVSLNGPAPVQLPAEGPAVYLLAPGIQQRVAEMPTVMTWLTHTLGMKTLSVQTYVVNRLMPWMQHQTGESAAGRLVAATQFIQANSATFDDRARQTLKAGIPWLLADGEIADAPAREGREIVLPEALEGQDGWHWLFINPSDREHFLVLSDDYARGRDREAWRKFLGECGATGIPDPAKRELAPGNQHYDEALARCAAETYGRPRLRDWACPRWLRDFRTVQVTQNGQQKIAALERWMKSFRHDYFEKFLRLAKKTHHFQEEWESLRSPSELGLALQEKPWLLTTRGYCCPPETFADTPENREFLGDSVPYVRSKLPIELLEGLGVRVRLSADVLISLLRQMREGRDVNLDLVIRIYRRLHDLAFDAGLFRREALVYLAKPDPPRWRRAGELVWQDAGAVFDEHFGYLELTYGEQDLHGFFTQKLQVPEEPALPQFAEVWAALSRETAPNRETTEKRLKRILDRLIAAQNDLAGQAWWSERLPELRIWTTTGGFSASTEVYAPDDGFAVELFAERVPVAWNPTQAHRFLPFIKSLGCRSLAAGIQATLIPVPSESASCTPNILTTAAKELIVLLVFNDPQWRWRDRLPKLSAVLATQEVLVPEVVVEYSLRDMPAVEPVRRPSDAFWQHEHYRLLLRTGAEADAWRNAVADSMAVALGDSAQRRGLADTIYRLLMATPTSAQAILRERNWSVSREQDEWLTQANWSRVAIQQRAEEAEPTRPPRTPPAKSSPPAPRPSESAGPPAGTPVPAVPSVAAPGLPAQTQSLPPESGLQPKHPVAEQHDQPSQGTPSPGVPPSSAAQAGGQSSDQAERPSDGPAARVRLKAEGRERPERRQTQARTRRPRRQRTHRERVERVSPPSEERPSGLDLKEAYCDRFFAEM